MNSGANAGPNPSEQHYSTSASDTNPGATAGHSTDDIGSDSDSSATHSSKSNLSDGSTERKDSHKLVLQSQFANDSRAQARNLLYKVCFNNYLDKN